MLRALIVAYLITAVVALCLMILADGSRKPIDRLSDRDKLIGASIWPLLLLVLLYDTFTRLRRA